MRTKGVVLRAVLVFMLLILAACAVCAGYYAAACNSGFNEGLGWALIAVIALFFIQPLVAIGILALCAVLAYQLAEKVISGMAISRLLLLLIGIPPILLLLSHVVSAAGNAHARCSLGF